MARLINATGHRYGLLTVLSRAENTPGGMARWQCRCDCGGETVTQICNLRSGNTTSCGCVARALSSGRLTTHGARSGAKRKAGTPEYKSWSGMIQRCTNPSNPSWDEYGGRGIEVCDRWRSFELFLSDVGERPSGTSIDRIDNDKGYEPGNVRWATRIEQNNNRRPRRWKVKPRMSRAA